ncbi:MAG: hypothetical protein JXR95_04080 [Deltaproteobacteria bacterium]|nr:hypothetical protein [Deltaproteobacteria bacterium]
MKRKNYFCMDQDLTKIKNLQSMPVLSDRLSSMGMLAAGIAHVINNPLSYLIYNISSLEKEFPRILSDVTEKLKQCNNRKNLSTDDFNEILNYLNPEDTEDIHETLKETFDGLYKTKDITKRALVYFQG